ncbi:MAG: cytochrome c biogenesis protein CcdA [Actinomycetota bacterium]|nr:cytochrome c biogenesis protein CcdA [Actinomycetota bacterium]
MLAAPVALVAGLVSFLSPCVLPLVPGYLSYLTGLSGADLAGREPVAVEPPVAGKGAVGVLDRTASPPTAVVRRGRVLVGCSLFVLGFSAVFVSYGALFGGIGGFLRLYETTVSRVLGVVSILLGLAFLGLVPGLQRELRVHRLPTAGLVGAPLLGVLFGVGWTPCIGPTLGVVLTLSTSSATAWRGALLSIAYCIGLGVPFVLVGLAFRRATGALGVLRRHSRTITAVGGAMLVAIGVLQLTGAWQSLVGSLQGYIGSFTTVV